jgi:heme exporter protein D
MDLLQAVVVAQLASTLVLVGIIWTVQVVHYPLMARVGRDRFVAYEAAHAPRMAAVVLVPWLLEGVTTAWLLVERPASIGAPLVWSGTVAALIPVLVTVVWSVPAHSRLSTGFDADVHARLVRTNWLRTFGWTAHAIVAILMAERTFAG